MKLLHFIALLSSILFISLMVTSCDDSEDVIEVRGCIDPTSDNYDPLATVDDGSCIPARAKFIGTFDGSFLCNGLLATLANSDSLEFVISEGIGADSLVSIQLIGIPAITFALDGTVAGNTLTVNNEGLGPVPIDQLGVMLTVLLDVSGDLDYDTIDDSISGDLMVTVTPVDAEDPFLVDSCRLEGSKR